MKSVYNVLALAPTLWLLFVSGSYIKAYIALGHLPQYGIDPDPTVLGVDNHSLLVFFMFVVGVLGVVLWPLLLIGRVTSGEEHNVLRSKQNLNDLTTLGIKTEDQLSDVFNRAFEKGTEISTKSSKWGTTVTKSVNIGKKGSLDVGFFYPNSNMNAIPSVSTIIPKIFK